MRETDNARQESSKREQDLKESLRDANAGCLVAIWLVSAGPFLLMGTIFTILGLLEMQEQARLNVESVEIRAEIVASDIAFGSRQSCWPKIKFRYEHDGHEYTSDRVWPIHETGKEEQIRELVQRHSTGKQVTAFMDPGDPSVAILEKRCGYPMAANDVFVSVAGGLRLAEPALDLPLMTAIASSLLNKALDPLTAVVGEVGLSGEVRGVTLTDRRVSEAARLGFKQMVLPEINAAQVTEKKIELVGVTDIQTALDKTLG